MKILVRTFATISIFAVLFGSFWFYKTRDFPLYSQTENSIRENSPNIPSKKIIQIASLGHENSYADLLWIGMIQYIGGNLSRGNFEKFSLINIERITEILPTFSTAYEWALWLMPIPQNSEMTYSSEQKKALELPLALANTGIKSTCDMGKIWKIFSLKLDNNLWEQTSLKNPCKSGMLPYLIAFYGGQLFWNQELAKSYYKVAWLSNDAPAVSQILAVISSADKTKPREIAKNFYIMAMWSYDSDENLSCNTFSKEAFFRIEKKSLDTEGIIDFWKNFEKLKKPEENATIGMQKCYDMAERWLKYTYIDFINNEAKKFPNIEKIENLLDAIGLKTAPTTPSQKNFTFYKNPKTGLWDYTQKN